jgi:hypothetical protein
MVTVVTLTQLSSLKVKVLRKGFRLSFLSEANMLAKELTLKRGAAMAEGGKLLR